MTRNALFLWSQAWNFQIQDPTSAHATVVLIRFEVRWVFIPRCGGNEFSWKENTKTFSGSISRLVSTYRRGSCAPVLAYLEIATCEHAMQWSYLAAMYNQMMSNVLLPLYLNHSKLDWWFSVETASLDNLEHMCTQACSHMKSSQGLLSPLTSGTIESQSATTPNTSPPARWESLDFDRTSHTQPPTRHPPDTHPTPTHTPCHSQLLCHPHVDHSMACQLSGASQLDRNRMSVRENLWQTRCHFEL